MISLLGVEPKIGVYAPKWMVEIMENPIKMDDLGGPPLFWETSIYNIGIQRSSSVQETPRS